jgi:hypothetical protein
VTTAIAPHAPSRACYLTGCREPGCVDANKRFCKQYRVDCYRNGPRRVDATEARATVVRYVEAGWSYSAIATCASCSETVIVDLVAGVPRINSASAQRIAALPHTPDGPRGHPCTDATGTIRRGRALARIGYQDAEIAAGLNMHPDTLTRILNRDHGLVLVRTARAMTALYEQWRWKPGRSERSSRRAERKGWHGPLAWDADIDDPKATPDTTGVGIDGARKRDSLRTDEIKHLAGFGFSAYTIAKQVGLDEKDVQGRIDKMRAEKAATQQAAA